VAGGDAENRFSQPGRDRIGRNRTRRGHWEGRTGLIAHSMRLFADSDQAPKSKQQADAGRLASL
jgi:hypothetical protein